MKNNILSIGSSTDEVFKHFCLVASWYGVSIELIDIPYEVMCNGNQIYQKIEDSFKNVKNIYIRFFENNFDKHNQMNIDKSIGLIIAQINYLKNVKIIHSINHNSTNFCKITHLESNRSICLKHNILVPDSMLSNHIPDLNRFIKKYVKVINKGNSNEKTTIQEISISNISKKITSPIFLQEYIIGTEIRVHLVDNLYVAEEIQTFALDYRLSQENKYQRHYLPKNVEMFCIELARKENLIFSGIDFRLIDNNYYFLEINSQPDYRGYDKRANFEITKNLIKYYSQ